MGSPASAISGGARSRRVADPRQRDRRRTVAAADTSKRAARWPFKTLHTLRHIVLRAGRLTRPRAS
jgi:hypothetical protein